MALPNSTDTYELAKDRINNFLSTDDYSSPAAMARDLRSRALTLNMQQGQNQKLARSATVSTPDTQGGDDWRVRIHMPMLSEFNNSTILAPLKRTNNSMVFPTTPQILVQHSANYSPMSPTHSNYAFPIYNNSAVEDITITCEWPIENEADGQYWIASVHFLRSVTKMFYGESSNKGAPPPICKMSGYGNYIFDEMPVVVKMFSMDLSPDQDYLKVPVTSAVYDDAILRQTGSTVGRGGDYTYVPTLGRISVVVGPAYSRNEVLNFSLDKFVQNIDSGGFI
jgi:hypothetical protein